MIARKLIAILIFATITGCAYNTPAPFRYIDSRPAYSPDGSRIAYIGKHGLWRTSRAWIMNADGSDQRCLLRDVEIADTPMWAPQGDEILLTDYYSTIWRPFTPEMWEYRIRYIAIDLDGNRLRVINRPKGMACIGYHPDGERLMWRHGEPTELWFSDRNGEDLKRVCEIGLRPIVSHDGRKVVFQRPYGPNARGPRYWSDICIADIHERSTRRLCEGWLQGMSPDGKTIVYSEDNRDQSINLIDIDGSNSRTIDGCVNQHARATFFLEGGKKLLRVYRAPWSMRVEMYCIIDLETGAREIIPLDPPLSVLFPFISPDGKRLLCVGGPRMSRGLYELEIGESRFRRLSPMDR